MSGFFTLYKYHVGGHIRSLQYYLTDDTCAHFPQFRVHCRTIHSDSAASSNCFFNVKNIFSETNTFHANRTHNDGSASFSTVQNSMGHRSNGIDFIESSWTNFCLWSDNICRDLWS